LDVFRVDRDLKLSSYQANLGECGAAGKAVGVVLYVWNWKPVRDGASVQGSVVSTGPPTAVLLWHEMEGGQPWAFGASRGAVPQHGVELGLGDGHAVWCQTAWAAGYRRAGCCTDVMCCAGPPGDTLLAWSVPGIPPGGCLVVCLQR